MSGDVQPRKRKDKKKKKDDLGLEEPRGTAAALGEGDVFIHSHSDHGTGGHWCAKIIFFSLLAVLVTLIGLIILENRGLSELEANAVESRYSNILEGWIEDAPDDDHHDEHTLELKHHDDEEEDHYDSQDVEDHNDEDEHETEDEDEHETEDEDEHETEDEDEIDEEDQQMDEEDDAQDSQQDLEADDEEEEDRQIHQPYRYYTQEDEDEDELENDEDTEEIERYEEDEKELSDEDVEEKEVEQDEDEDEQNDEDENEQNDEDENEENDEDGSNEELDNEAEDRDEDDEENQTKEDEDEHDEHDEEDDDEVEKIEREASEDEEPISTDLPALPEEDDDDDHDSDDDKEADDNDEDEADDDDHDNDGIDDDFLEAPVTEHVTAPAGKPFVEVEDDDVSTESPPDTLEEEEEYEKRQEELRKEEEQSSHHMWLKLTIGAALLVATHAVLRRATAPRDEPEEQRVEREDTPLVDRRMTLIPEQAAPPVVPKKVTQESTRQVVEEVVRREAPIVKAPPVVVKQESEEEEVDEPELEDVVEEEEIDEPETLETPTEEAEKNEKEELYSDEEIEEEEKVEVLKKEAFKAVDPPKSVPDEEPEDDVPDDVEIIDDEQLEEELEEEEEDVSDVDDAELLSRLEAKYGRLPEPERPGQKHKDGGNSVEDMWPGEPADAYWRQQLDSAERDLRQGSWSAAMERASAAELRQSARARYLIAAALDRQAEARRDNGLLTRAIAAYFDLLEMSDRLPDKKLLDVARRTLDRIQFRGNYLKAEPVYRLLIRRFPDEPGYRNNLTITFLMSNRNDLAENVLKETLARWPEDRIALAHYGFVLKISHKDKLEEAVKLFQKALEGDEGPACEPRFYYHYGDALLLLGRYKEAHEVHKRGAKLGHFLSPAQRSLYNVPRLKSRPWWNVDETPYAVLARNLEKRWKEILKEGEKAVGLFREEEEGLRERGQWSQLDVFARGREVAGRCRATPVTCAVVRAEPAAAGCRRGQVKFSAMAAGTHVRPHVGPTNCRLRMHLGLSNTSNTYIRVDQETRQWQEGKVLLFDDSFEHEVWHNGSGTRLVLIVDVWHPDLTPTERRTLPAI